MDTLSQVIDEIVETRQKTPLPQDRELLLKLRHKAYKARDQINLWISEYQHQLKCWRNQLPIPKPETGPAKPILSTAILDVLDDAEFRKHVRAAQVRGSVDDLAVAWKTASEAGAKSVVEGIARQALIATCEKVRQITPEVLEWDESNPMVHLAESNLKSFQAVDEVLISLLGRIESKLNGDPVPARPRAGKTKVQWENAGPPTGWHVAYIEDQLKWIVQLMGESEESLSRNNGTTHWIQKCRGKLFRLYFKSDREFAQKNAMHKGMRPQADDKPPQTGENRSKPVA